MMHLTATTDVNGTIHVSITDGEKTVDVHGTNFWKAILAAYVKITLQDIREHIQSARA